MSIRERIGEFFNRIRDFGGSFLSEDTEVSNSDPEELKKSVMDAVKRGEMTKKEAEEIFKGFKDADNRAGKFNKDVEAGVTVLPSERGESPFIETVDTPVVGERDNNVRAKGGREIDD